MLDRHMREVVDALRRIATALERIADNGDGDGGVREPRKRGPESPGDAIALEGDDE